MAPKARCLKRPAASSHAGSPLRKRAAVQPCEAPLPGAEALPARARAKLMTLLGDQELEPSTRMAAEELVGTALATAEEALACAVQEALVEVQTANQEITRQQEAVQAAEDAITGLQQTVSEARLGVQQAAKSMEVARKEFKTAKAVEKSIRKQSEAAVSHMAHLEAIDKKAYQPFKSAPATGAKGKKQLLQLRKAGKEFGFHDVLVNNTMPKVLTKRLDRRHTFDRLAMQQLDREFSKHRESLKSTIEDGAVAISSQVEAVEAAHTAEATAKQDKNSHSRILFEAKKLWAPSKESLAIARRALRMGEQRLHKAEKRLQQAEEKMTAFCGGPLAAFKAVQTADSKPEEEDEDGRREEKGITDCETAETLQEEDEEEEEQEQEDEAGEEESEDQDVAENLLPEPKNMPKAFMPV